MSKLRNLVPRNYRSINLDDQRFVPPPRRSTVSQVMADTLDEVLTSPISKAQKSKRALAVTKALVSRRKVR
jgi:hypothetical protein